MIVPRVTVPGSGVFELERSTRLETAVAHALLP